jgi:hypothetical protein
VHLIWEKYYANGKLPIHIRPHLVREVKLLGPFSRSIRSINRRLFTKIITRMNRKSQDESIKSN